MYYEGGRASGHRIIVCVASWHEGVPIIYIPRSLILDPDVAVTVTMILVNANSTEGSYLRVQVCCVCNDQQLASCPEGDATSDFDP